MDGIGGRGFGFDLGEFDVWGIVTDPLDPDPLDKPKLEEEVIVGSLPEFELPAVLGDPGEGRTGERWVDWAEG